MRANHFPSAGGIRSANAFQRPLLRKQISCVEVAPPVRSIAVAPAHRTTAAAAARPGLRKQLSVDQALLGGSASRTIPTGGSSIVTGRKPVETASRAFVSVKKRGATTIAESSNPSDPCTAPSAATIADGRRSDDRINLNIFLSPGNQHHHHSQEGEPSDSERDSSSSAPSSDIIGPSSKTVPITASTVEPAPLRQTQCTSATDRRAAFVASKSMMSLDRKVPAVVGAAVQPTLPQQQPPPPPPLIRAMSAPLRGHDDSKQMLAKRRLSRRRRPQRDRSLEGMRDQSSFYMEQLDEGAADEDGGGGGGEAVPSGGARRGASAGGRSRSVLGGRPDVVTLVSLLSSGGSDSEREEDGDNKAEELTGRAPTLRKTGKSVSFQETETNSVAGTLDELPLVLRRGSIAPLAARIRANRPPTAPPGSIYMRQEFHRSLTKPVVDSHDVVVGTTPALTMSVSPNGDTDVAAAPKAEHASASDGVASTPASINSATVLAIDYPAFCRSAKERECWVMFQKMLHKGVTVSYETILRGLLTPTEMRAVLKQRDADDEKQRQQELNDGDSTGSPPAATTVRCS